MIKILFKNSMAVPNRQTIQCSEESIQPILHWYFSHYSGDPICVYKNGKRMKLNDYGDILT